MKPVVFMCGASDVKRLSGIFDKAMREMNCIPAHYFNGSHRHSNLSTWPENSIKQVKESSIIVYVIIEKYGGITWETEYATALLEGKQFIILCLKDIFDAFLRTRGYANPDEDLSKTFDVLTELHTQQRTIATFEDDESFTRIVKDEIMQIFSDGLELLNKKKPVPVLKAITDENKAFLESHVITSSEEQILRKKLFESKSNSLRKGIVQYFAEKGLLSTEEVLKLMDDRMQGVYRKVYDVIPLFDDRKIDLDRIFAKVIQKATAPNRDVRIDNVGIPNIIKRDIQKAIIPLIDLFPAKSINAPKRILSSINDDFEKLFPALNDHAFRDKVRQLTTLSRDYNPTSDNLQSLAKQIFEKLDALEN